MIENKKERDIKQEKLTLRDAIKTYISSEINNIGFISLFIIDNLMTYLLSYLRELQGEKKTIGLEHSYFFGMITSMFEITPIFAATIQKKIGLRFSVVLGGIIIILALLLILFSKSFILDLIGYFIIALGSFPSSLMERNFVSYFYEIRGKIFGMMALSYALETSGFNMLAEKFIINPESDEADVDENFYTYEVSKRIMKYIIIILIIFTICFILSLIIVVPFNKKKHGEGLFRDNSKDDSEIRNSLDNYSEEEEEHEGEDENKKDDNKLLDKKDEQEDEDEKRIEVKKDKKIKKQSFSKRFFKKALRSRRVIFLFLMKLCSTPLSLFVGASWRNMAIRNNIPTKYQQNVETYKPIIECLSTLIFSSLSDSFSFRYMYFILSLLSAFVGIFFCFTLQSPVLFTIILMIEHLSKTGKLALNSPHFIKVFGLKHYLEINGLISSSNIIVIPICNFFLYLFDKYYATNAEGDEEFTLATIFDSDNAPYSILFITCGILNIISAVLSCFETEDIFII